MMVRPLTCSTRVLKIHPDTPEEGPLQEAAEVLLHGGLVAFPTETVYGLGALALNPEAVKRIYQAKGRPAADPLIVHGLDLPMLQPLTPLDLSRLEGLRQFWPGPLTLVVPRGAQVPLEVTAGLDAVALRIPAHPVARGLLATVKAPIAAPSANAFTRPSATEARHVLQDLSDRFELLLDGGPTLHGLESTVIDLTEEVPTLLRPGALTPELLQPLFPNLLLPAPRFEGEQVALKSPGTQLKHYAPRARMTLFKGSSQAVRQAMRDELEAHLALGLRVGLLLCEEDLLAFQDLPVELASLGSQTRLEEAGARLFGGLRLLDERRVEVIFSTLFEEAGLGRTLNDRLIRASEGRVRPVP